MKNGRSVFVDVMMALSFQILLSITFLPTLASAQSWIQLTPTGSLPNGRVNPSATYAPTSNRLIVFGGYAVHTSSPFPFLNDVWILSNANGIGSPAWQQAIPQGTAGSPPPRGAAVTFYDQATNRMIIFGGQDSSGVFGDVWVLVGADGTGGAPTWTQLAPSNPPPTRLIPTAAYDSANNRLIIFGGQPLSTGSTFLYNDVWVLTNANGTEANPPAWIQLQPGGTLPSPRSHQIGAFDPATNKLIIYGGISLATGNLTETWVLSNANGLGGTPAWTQLAPTGQPDQLLNTSAFFDPASQRLIMFGGTTNANVDTNELFVLTNATNGGTPAWQQLNPSGTLPLPRDFWGGDYDKTDNELIVFGGEDVMGPGNATTFNDTWILTNANGAVSAQLGVNQAFPNHGGNTGQVTVQVIGSGFQSGDAVKLSGGGADITGTNVNLLNSSSLTATFGLSGATAGARNVVVTNGGGTSASLANGFTVQPGGGPQLWANLTGRNKIRIGVPQTFYVTYGNYGNTDSLGTKLMVYVPSTLSPNLTFGNANGVSSSVTEGSTTVVTVNIGRVAAGSTVLVPITMTAGIAQAPFQVQVEISGH